MGLFNFKFEARPGLHFTADARGEVDGHGSVQLGKEKLTLSSSFFIGRAHWDCQNDQQLEKICLSLQPVLWLIRVPYCRCSQLSHEGPSSPSKGRRSSARSSAYVIAAGSCNAAERPS